MLALSAGVFLAPYLAWRPLEIMFTSSDALFCIAVVFLGIGQALTPRPFGALTPLWLIGFVVMVTGLLIGSVANGEPLRWGIAAAQYGFALVILPALLIGHGLERTYRLARIMLAGLVIMESFGILIYFLGPDIIDHHNIGPGFISGSQRLGVYLMDANWNGAFIAMVLPFVLYLHGKRQLAGWQAVVAGGVLVEGLLLAASVSALACAVFGVGAMIAVGGRRLKIWPVAIGLAAVSLYFIAGGPLPRAFSVRVAPAIDNADIGAAGTFNGRFSLMQEAWQMVGDTMVVGLGVDQYRVVSATGAPVHNMYLLLWTEGGLLALFGWVMLLAILVVAALMAYRRDRVTAALALAVITAVLASSTASPHMYARLWFVPLLIAMAFVFECANQEKRQ